MKFTKSWPSKPSSVVKKNTEENISSEIQAALDLTTQLKFKHEICINKKTLKLFLQDEFMLSFQAIHPEFLIIDTMCEIPQLEQSLILLIGVDSNGHCEIISVGLIKCEALEGLVWICDMFKKHNPSWEKLELILSDQSCDSNFLKAAFPEKVTFTSFFHSIKSFKTDLSSLDNVATEQNINEILQLFEKMMFETTEVGYQDLLKQMKQMNAEVYNLFKIKWHVKRDTWALGLLIDSQTFLKPFNEYLLRLRRKIKPAVSGQETLESVIRNLHSSIYKLRKEWFQNFTKMFPNPTAPYLKIPAMEKYAELLTPFACELVYEQLIKSNNIKNVKKVDRESYFKVDENLGTSNTCCCTFYKFTKLPCCHILSIRKLLSLPQFFQTMRPSTSVLANYYRIHNKLYSAHVSEHEESKAIEMCRRFEAYVRICSQLWSKIFNCNEKMSQERLEAFQNILKSWKNDFDVAVVTYEKEENLSVNYKETLQPTDSLSELYGLYLNDIIECEEFLDAALMSDDSLDISIFDQI